jgi:hypothetical protein
LISKESLLCQGDFPTPTLNKSSFQKREGKEETIGQSLKEGECPLFSYECCQNAENSNQGELT